MTHRPVLPRLDDDRPDTLRFAPLAWLKLQWFCHAGRTEVGGFGISAADDLLYVEDFVTVGQHATPIGVRFDDAAVADFFDGSVDRGLKPEQFARIWVHTHPGDSPEPSGTDEETFLRSFGRCAWAVMCILSRTGRSYGRLAFAAGPGGQLYLPVAVDWIAWPETIAGAGKLNDLIGEWQQEFVANVHHVPEPCVASSAGRRCATNARSGLVGPGTLERRIRWHLLPTRGLKKGKSHDPSSRTGP